MTDMTNNELVNDELATVTDFAENNGEVAVAEDTAGAVANTVKEEGNLVKEVGEILVVGVIIYGFCKLVDWIVDKVKAGIKSLKEKRAAKKAAKAAAQQAQAPAQGAPVANVEKPVEGEQTQQ